MDLPEYLAESIWTVIESRDIVVGITVIPTTIPRITRNEAKERFYVVRPTVGRGGYRKITESPVALVRPNIGNLGTGPYW